MLMLVPVYQATWLGIPVDQNFSAKSESRDPRHHDRHRLPWSRRDFQAGILQRRRTHHGCFAVVHGGAWDHLRTRILLSGGARHFRSAFHSCNVAVARMARDASMLRAANALLCQGPHHEPGRAGADLGGAGLYHSQVDYRQTGEWAMFEYKMVVSTFALKNFKALAGTLVGLPNVLDFHVSPTAQ